MSLSLSLSLGRCAFSVCLERSETRCETLAFKSAQMLANENSIANSPGLSSTLEAAQYKADWNYTAPTHSPQTQGANGLIGSRANPAYSSFRRQLSIAERKLDPQTAIINNPAAGSSGLRVARESWDEPIDQLRLA